MKYLTQNDGAVALITTIIVSVLLLIVTTGLIATMSSELRQQDDNEQSDLAYYAAQSGVEDAISKITAQLAVPGGPLTSQDCSNPLSSLSNEFAATGGIGLDRGRPGKVGWTCQIINFSGQPIGSLKQPDAATQVNPGTKVAYDYVKVEWDRAAPNGPNYFNDPAVFPAVGSWIYAPPLELAIAEYPTGSFPAGAGSVSLHNLLLLPSTIAGVQTVEYASLTGASGTSNPVQTLCAYVAGNYSCSAYIHVPTGVGPNNAYIFRIRSRYKGTDYRLTFLKDDKVTKVDVPDGAATVDVTAKAGDAFRRVLYSIPYAKGAAVGLDFVIYSDTNVCKDFTIIGNSVTDRCP